MRFLHVGVTMISLLPDFFGKRISRWQQDVINFVISVAKAKVKSNRNAFCFQKHSNIFWRLTCFQEFVMIPL